MYPVDGKFGMQIPAVDGTQTIWVNKELLSMDLINALLTHFNASPDQVTGWLELLENRQCRALRKDGLPCNGNIKGSDIPKTPDLFNPHIRYTCWVHITNS